MNGWPMMGDCVHRGSNVLFPISFCVPPTNETINEDVGYTHSSALEVHIVLPAIEMKNASTPLSMSLIRGLFLAQNRVFHSSQVPNPKHFIHWKAKVIIHLASRHPSMDPSSILLRVPSSKVSITPSSSSLCLWHWVCRHPHGCFVQAFFNDPHHLSFHHQFAYSIFRIRDQLPTSYQVYWCLLANFTKKGLNVQFGKCIGTWKWIMTGAYRA